jgi:hypothetical protein
VTVYAGRAFLIRAATCGEEGEEGRRGEHLQESLLNEGRHLGMISHSAPGRAAFGASESDRIAVDPDLMREAIGLN